MVILGQSYASPTPMCADEAVYLKMLEHYGEKMITASPRAPRVRNLSKLEVFKQSVKCHYFARANDIIFGWGGDLCLYAWLIGRIFKKNLHYLSQNLIINPEIIHDKFRRRIRCYLYKMALHSEDFEVTVNAPGLVDFYSKMFDCSSKKFHLVYDSMDISEGKQNLINKGKSITPPMFFLVAKLFAIYIRL